MMKRNTFILLFFGITFSVISQISNGFSYQAVIRDGETLLKNQDIKIMFSILREGTEIFNQIKDGRTNENGLLSTTVGGTPAFLDIDWANGPLFIQTRIDPNGGFNFTIETAPTQLLTVPYALVAETALNAPPGEQGPQGEPGIVSAIQPLFLEDQTISIDLSNYAEIDMISSLIEEINELKERVFILENPELQHEMVLVQAGTFTMGCTSEQGSDCFSQEYPAHQVTLTNNYYIGKYAVTQAQWVAVMGSWPNSPPSLSYGVGDNYPAYYISWNDIVGASGTSMVIDGITYYENGFIYKLNQMTGKQYRLPTEAEWEYAARGGSLSKNYKYSGSNNINDVAWYNDNNAPYGTKPVGIMQPNELGIYDMSGNVWEWVRDWFGNYTSDPKINPTGPATGSYRVNRGGSWGSRESYCRVSYRYNSNYPVNYNNYLGFRLALSQ